MNLAKDHLSNYFEDSSTSNLVKLLDELLESEYSLRDVDITSRNIHSWYKNKLLPYDEKDSRKHRFTFFEVIWIWIIEDLRKFGYSYKAIRKAKEYIMAPFNLRDFLEQVSLEEIYNSMNDIYNIGPPFSTLSKEQIEYYKEIIFKSDHSQLNKIYPAISLLILDFIHTRNDWIMLFNQVGEVWTGTRSDYAAGINDEFFNTPYIVLPIVRYFSRLLNKIRFLVALGKVNYISDTEMEVLELLSQGELKEVTYIFAKGEKPTFVEITKEKRVYEEARICEMINNSSYESLNVKTRNGHVVYATKTTKIKLDD